MSASETAGKNSTVQPLPNHALLITAISHATRWKMLKELSAGEPREIAELAAVGGCSYENARKHLAVLVGAGLVTQGRGRLGSIQFPNNICRNRVGRSWTSAIACCDWMRRKIFLLDMELLRA